MGYSTTLKNQVVTYIAGKGSALTPSTMYLAMYNGDPLGVGVQVGSRVAITNAMGVASNGSITNTSDIMWPRTTAALGQVTHVALFNAASGGTLFGAAALQSPVNIGANVTPTIPAGFLVISLT